VRFPVTVLLAASTLVSPAALPGAAAADDGAVDCSQIQAQPDGTSYSTDAVSAPLLEMGVDEALTRLRQQRIRPGSGVTVAVVDSGVSRKAPVEMAGRFVASKQAEPTDYHGTAVAGLIAGAPRSHQHGGPVGIAPGARIYDVKVYDEADARDAEDSAQAPMTPDNLRRGLQAVIDAVPRQGISIVNISLALPDDDEVRALVERLTAMGVAVVAPTGNRTELPPTVPASYAQHRSGEDAAPYVHPADYDGVIGVSATPRGSTDPDPMSWVLENSHTDVAAPTAGAVSYSLRGESCLMTDPATSYAAAEVSGALALLQSAYRESMAASVSRLLATADGRPDVPNTMVGAGQLQVMDALTRPMQLRDDGTVTSAGSVEHTAQVLSVPEEPDDVLASTREDVVWWGLAGGGVLLLALLLRPLLARRRRTLSG
jgi:membrane-anchored mycosin MYCP